MDSDKYIGRFLDNRYEILEVIGTGGMAVVYKARCHRLNRLVAIKILKDEYSQDEEFRRRFHAEGQAVAMLSHPNIVSVYDVSTSSNADYIVMELIDGITLKQYMEKKGVLNWKETLHFSMQIAKALEHAHSRGIVHRDIKPHNVMVLKNGSVKVADFGIARIMSKGNTLTKEALGSVHYISPEQAKGGRVDNRSDIYSLGVVMYEMMAGRPPYDGESPVAVAIQHINGGAPMPSTINPNIPGGLEQIIMKAMAHEPNDRYPTATAMLYDMDEFRKDPTILFDYGLSVMDDATQIRPTPLVTEEMLQKSRTTAERVAERSGTPRESIPERRAADGVRTGAASGQQAVRQGANPPRTAAPARSGTQPARTGKPRQTSRTEEERAEARRRREAQEQRSRTTMIAIIACSVVAVAAVAIFLIVMFSGGVRGGEDTIPVPSLLGKDYATLATTYGDVTIRLRDRKYSETYPQGTIMDQYPLPDTMVAKNSEVFVDVSLGEEPETKVMQDLINMDRATAVSYLEGQGFANPLIREEDNASYAKGRIIRTDPIKDTPLTEGQNITLWVSSGMMSVPNVKGQTVERAEAMLRERGFNNVVRKEVDSEEDAGTVVRQSAIEGSRLDVTTLVTLEVSSGKVSGKVPNVVGRSVDTAVNMLKSAGFSDYRIEQTDSDKEKDEVVRQTPDPDTKADVTTTIVLYVSNGPTEPTTEPTEPTVTKTVKIALGEGLVDKFKVTIKLGNTVVHEETLPAGETSITVELTGSGVQYFDVYVNDQYLKPEKVDFTA